MMQKTQPIRSTLLTVLMAGFATAASAAGVGVNANNVGAQAGGNAETRMSPAGSANSNAQWQDGATKGADRATERMSPKGADMKQSVDAEPDAAGKAALKGKR
ncbi:hypothetical protein [Thiobacillus sp.]|uniref:hypothetical protein n=1 Tax=Thiobacillus sp. TaxID=924 RepID=UPI0025F95637|nr:hypothetical protein [Thiobacillus sp.]